ncbi:hypothetical protein [Archangium sp.]|jgi:hypothetical protein|uniref:hypothetical protein n=1 Tax=Archangium sp. TaxID=1872627 RepID=UPI00389A1889
MESASVQPISVPASEPLVPNQFELLGRGISVTFSSTSFSGQPLLHYQDGCHEVNARGEDIRQVETELGTLVTITLEPDADAGELLLTVLIPRARLEGVGSEVRIATEAILTRGRFPRGPASSAQLQMYMVVALRGRATFVVS